MHIRRFSTVYLVSLDYEISLPHPSPYHTSQQAADLVFEPTMKRSQKREKFNFDRIFLAKNSKRENNFTKLTSLMLDFAKKMLETLLISAFSSPLTFNHRKFPCLTLSIVQRTSEFESRRKNAKVARKEKQTKFKMPDIAVIYL